VASLSGIVVVISLHLFILTPPVVFSMTEPMGKVFFRSAEGSGGSWRWSFAFAGVWLDLSVGKQCFEILFALYDFSFVSADF
jgi:hypothetical protein